MTKSCQTCPWRVPADDLTVYVQSPGADSCAKHGHILSKPGLSSAMTQRIQETFATRCPDHGTNRGTAIPVLTAQVAIGDPSTFSGTVDPALKPASCTQCANFIPAPVVTRELGWTLGMCAAKGRLLFSNRLVDEAKDCGVGQRGQIRDTTDGVILRPEYEGVTPTRIGRPEPYDADAEMAKHQVDPREYPTDKPVTPDEAAGFVRAWRKVLDPDGLRPPIFIPIFDGPALIAAHCPRRLDTDAGYGKGPCTNPICDHDPRSTYGGHRPDLYVDHMGLIYDLAVEWWELDENPLLQGPSGTGKTEAVAWWAWLLDIAFDRESIKKGTQDYHLAGETRLEVDPATGQTVTSFRLAPFTKAYSSIACAIVIDEPNLNTDVYEFLRPVFDNARMLEVDGNVIRRGKYVFVAAAQNDPNDPIYVGTSPMSAAEHSRLSPIQFGLPDESVERAIIRKHCNDSGYVIDERLLDKIMQIAATLRKMIADGELPIAWGIRDQVKVARKTRYYGRLEKAFRRAVIDGLEASVIEMVLPVVRTVDGG